MPLLDWVNRNQAEETATSVPYHLLKFEQAYGDEEQAKENLIIQGDNLQALKALLPLYGGQVKCIFIDPPYNTEQAFEHYDDNLEHAQWLSMMYPRIVLLRELLENKGIFCVILSDHQVHYMKVLCDEIFGRNNFINEVSLKMKQTAGASGGGEDKRLKKNIEYLLIYSKDKNFFSKFNEILEEENLFDFIEEMKESGKSWKYTRVLESTGEKSFYKTIYDGKGDEIKVFQHVNPIFTPISVIAAREGISEQQVYIKYFEKVFRDTNAQSSIRTRVMESLEVEQDLVSIEYVPKSGRSKGNMTTVYYKGRNCDQIAWLSDIAYKKGNRLVKLSKLGTYWDGFPLNNLTKEGGVRFPNGKKPEALIQRVLELCTQQNDLVLDSFLGSGTTTAVAHKMGRRYIGIEMGPQANTHVIPRLRNVIGGEEGGISKSVNWKGGGGFSFFSLGSPVFDDQGFLNADVKFKDLASYVWWLETKTALNQTESFDNPYLGTHDGVAYYLLYNGILGDRRPNGGNVLTLSILNYLNECHAHEGKRVVIGEASRLGDARLEALDIEFKQIPYSLYGNQAQ
ncbi:site-specific DNA-methyltransferase [Acinetobacter indicus]|uniref:site-specific DNA-methyltransferase n=1 Tax=Acinetobacter indicus TaxID=756892 RepID=UPI002574A1A5|nr:site-specific DNA-methyltransferase [Acinetobacter indicus]